MTQASNLKDLITRESIQALLDNIMFMDESSAIPISKLDVLYAVIKTGMTKPGKKIPLGNIFVPDGDDGVLVDFGEKLDGIVLSMFQEKSMHLEETDSENAMARCGTVGIPPINGRVGFRHGECSKCVYGTYVEGQVSACLPVMKFIMLREVHGELKLIQIKAKGINQKPSKDAWVAYAAKVKGRTLSHIANFGTEEKSHKSKKDNKEYNVNLWTINPGDKVDLSIEQQELLKMVKAVVQDYQVTKFNLMQQLTATEGSHPMAITSTGGMVMPQVITHQATPAAAPMNQVADLAIDAEVTEEAPAAVTAETQKRVLPKKTAASDISI